MRCSKNKAVTNKKLEQWLNGMSLKEKIETAEKGKLVICLKCGKVFHDKEPSEERNLRKCKPTRDEHNCVEDGNYIVLRRGFLGILESVAYPDDVDEEQAIIDYFNNRK